MNQEGELRYDVNRIHITPARIASGIRSHTILRSFAVKASDVKSLGTFFVSCLLRLLVVQKQTP